MVDGKRIFLTGGTGFFGKSMIHWLAERKLTPQITILSRDPDSFLSGNPAFVKVTNLSFVTGDIRTFAFPSGVYDWVIHGATEASVTVPDEEMYAVCTEGTRHVLDFAEQCGCKRFMLISSGGVYGSQPSALDVFSEEDSCCPTTAYGKGKLVAEELALSASIRSGMDVVIPRCFAFVGPYLNLDIHFAIGNFMRDCLGDRPVVIHGDGSALRSYLYADDLVEWLFAILLRGETRRIYNVGSDVSVSIKELAEIVCSAAGVDGPVVVKGKRDVNRPVERYIPRIDRIKEELGVEVKVPLAEAIRRSIEFHRSFQR